MKKILTLLTCFNLLSANAQITCAANTFYGFGNDLNVHKYTISGNTITHNGIVTQYAGFSHLGLAIANLDGSNTFYTSKTSATVLYDFEVMKYISGNWESIYTDNHARLNAAGRGNYLYFQDMFNSIGPQYLNRIERFDGTNMTTIWTDPNVATAVGDLAVDDSGNVYFFTGGFDGVVSSLNVVSPIGEILHSFPISFPGTGAFGCFISGSTIYVGFALQSTTYPNKLLPITIVDGTAVIGTPLTIPTITIGTGPNGSINLYLSDLESCSPTNLLGTSSYQSNHQMNVYASNNQLTILSNHSGSVIIYNALSQKTSNFIVNENIEKHIDISSYASGLYFVNFNIDGKIVTKKFLKQ